MAIDSKLMKAILAMDSYNRGYNEGIVFTNGNAVVGTQIGNYTVSQQSDFEAGKPGVNAGFYAIAYQDNVSGAVTVSYRGTDDQPKFWRGGLMPLGAAMARSSAGLSA